MSWKTKKKKTIVNLVLRQNYRAMSTIMSKIEWISYLIHDLFIPPMLPIFVYYDNKATQQITANPIFHERSKHLNIDYHYTGIKLLKVFCNLLMSYPENNLQTR